MNDWEKMAMSAMLTMILGGVGYMSVKILFVSEKMGERVIYIERLNQHEKVLIKQEGRLDEHNDRIYQLERHHGE